MMANMSNTFSSLSVFSCRHELQSNYSVWLGVGVSGVPIRILGMGVPPSSRNPDSILDQRIPFFHTHSQARTLKSIAVFGTGPWVIAMRELTVKERIQFQQLITSDMCSPTQDTHIPSDVCSPTWETHIPNNICSPTQETHISSDMCFPNWDRETHILSDMYSPIW